jgi:hypothetical protein
MANAVQILDKIERNCKQLGLTTSRSSATALVAEGMTITYSAAVIQSPMGGIDGATSPFLGIGIAAPGKIAMDLGGADLGTRAKVQVLHIVAGHANSIVLSNALTGAVNGEIQGHVDALGMGM